MPTIDLTYILDRSGSMSILQEHAVTAFNDFLKSQLDVPGDATLSLIQFDDAYEVHLEAVPLERVPQLTAATYVPRGSTALLDALGRSITDAARRLHNLPAEAQPAKVIFAIFTDGLENASTRYTSRHVNDLIRLHRQDKGWEFLFLAANQDAIATATSMSMDSHSSGNYQFSEAGIKSGSRAMSRKISALRKSATGNLDAQAIEDQAKPLDQIVREEEQNPPEK